MFTSHYDIAVAALGEAGRTLQEVQPDRHPAEPQFMDHMLQLGIGMAVLALVDELRARP